VEARSQFRPNRHQSGEGQVGEPENFGEDEHLCSPNQAAVVEYRQSDRQYHSFAAPWLSQFRQPTAQCQYRAVENFSWP